MYATHNAFMKKTSLGKQSVQLATRMIEDVPRAAQFVWNGIWQIESRQLTPARAFGLRVVRVFVLATRKFVEDRCVMRAAALTLYLLLSIVPILALAFAITKGFGVQQRLEQFLEGTLQMHQQVVQHITAFAKNPLEKASGGVVASVGIIFLLWSVLKVLSIIESSFNAIWGVTKPRTIARKFTDYFSMVVLCPLILIVSSSLTVAINNQVKFMAARIALLGVVAPLLTKALHITPYILIWILFTFLYLFMPNTKVKWSSGIIAGIVAGTIYQVVLWGYVTFQIGVARYNAIYAGFAALPLFVIWLQASWMTVLYGTAFAYGWQNVHLYEFMNEALNASPALRKRLALVTMHAVVKRFVRGAPPASERDLHEETGIPWRLLERIINELVAAGLLNQVRSDTSTTPLYQPARDPASITVLSVLQVLDAAGIDTVPFTATESAARLADACNHVYAAASQSPANTPLHDIP
jgi:membrane protein